MNREIKYLRKRLEYLRGIVPILAEKRKKYKDFGLDYCRAELLGCICEMERKLKGLERRLK